MSIALVCFGCIVFVTTLSAVKLSIWIEVGGCGWPISSRSCLWGIAARELMYSAPSSASAADDMTALMICAIVRTAPLLCGISLSLDRKKCPPALLRAFDLER